MGTDNHYCPNKSYGYHGWAGYGNIRANGYPNSARWHHLERTVCHSYLIKTTGAISFGKQTLLETILRSIKALAESLGIRATIPFCRC